MKPKKMCQMNNISLDVKLKIGKALASVCDSDGLAIELVKHLEDKASSEHDFITKASQLFAFAEKDPFSLESVKKSEMTTSTLYKKAIADISLEEVSKVSRHFEMARNSKRAFSDLAADFNNIINQTGNYCSTPAKRFHKEEFSPDPIIKCKRVQKLEDDFKKNVSFDETALEKVFEIPSKEHTWPYGSLYGDSLPQVFTEFETLYDYDIQNKVAKKSYSFDRENFDLESSLGKCLLLSCGRIGKIVSATSKKMCAKMFVRFESLKTSLAFYDKYIIHPDDYIETDKYEIINIDDIVSEVFIACVDHIAQKTDPLPSMTKYYHFAWYFHSSNKELIPYPLSGRSVRVFWPEDHQHYLARIVDVNKNDGSYCLEYDVDGSTEWLNIVKLRDDKSLEFLP